MSKRTDSNSYTMTFAVIMVLVVGSMLAFLASSLKPFIDENERIEKQQNILYALGVNENDAVKCKFCFYLSCRRLRFQKYITKQIEVIEGGNEISESDRCLSNRC